MSNRILLLDICLTILCSLTIFYLGTNLVFLFAGFLISLLPSIFNWNNQMKRYDNLLRQPVTEYSTRMKIFSFVMLFVITFGRMFINGIVDQKLADQATFSFAAGLLVAMWFSYFQIIYWEKKNQKMIYFDKSYGIWKQSFIILESK
jgi:hypothetical protein